MLLVLDPAKMQGVSGLATYRGGIFHGIVGSGYRRKRHNDSRRSQNERGGK
jgi:hypothetical protein